MPLVYGNRPTMRNPHPISELKIGPFSGGINRYSDASAIADTELVDCINFDIDLDGSLKSRPPWTSSLGHQETTYTGTLTEGSTQVLGSFIYSGYRIVVYQVVSNNTSGTATVVSINYYWLDGPSTGTVTNIYNDSDINNPFTAVVRYKDILYFTRKNGGTAGGSYNVNTSTWTPITFPAASSALIYKERLWLVGDKITNTSRLYFSDVATPQTFQPASFFDIRPGDGDTLNDFIVYQDNMFLFKDSSIWVFAYDTQPAQAVLQQLHSELGVSNSHCLALYENSIYFLRWNQVYSITNFNFTRISTKIPFEEDRTLPIPKAGENWGDTTWKFPSSLSLMGDRLIIRYYNRLYVYHLRMNAWTRWSSQDPVINYMGNIVQVENTGGVDRPVYSSYVAGTALTKIPFKGLITSDVISGIIIVNDNYDTSTKEGYTYKTVPVTYVDILCSAVTKIYDIGISQRFKRLMHWGVDVVTGRSVTGILSPYSVAYRVTWAQLHQYTWSQLQTWGYPLFVQPNTTQTATVDSGLYRRFVRFPKGLRFRLMQFTVNMVTAGNSGDGPARMYSLTAVLGVKQLVDKGVN